MTVWEAGLLDEVLWLRPTASLLTSVAGTPSPGGKPLGASVDVARCVLGVAALTWESLLCNGCGPVCSQCGSPHLGEPLILCSC